jgi:DNA-binding MarR family transcriptional regulator
MDAYSTAAASRPDSTDAPVLLAATSDRAAAIARNAIEASGLRIGATVPLELAMARIGQQIRTSAVWIEVDRDCGAALDDVLDYVSRDVADGRYAAVVSTSREALDPVEARAAGAVELIVDADEAERIAALAVTIARQRAIIGVADVASDRSSERLRQLSEEVSRIASTLARLSSGPGMPARRPEPAIAGDAPPLSVEVVRNVIRARRLRSRYFAEDLFADPAWDMLLDLLQAEIAQLRVPVSSLCIAAAVPATTALRWLKTLVSQGIFIRRADPHDGRRVFVELSRESSHALRRYFAEVGQAAVI